MARWQSPVGGCRRGGGRPDCGRRGRSVQLGSMLSPEFFECFFALTKWHIEHTLNMRSCDMSRKIRTFQPAAGCVERAHGVYALCLRAALRSAIAARAPLEWPVLRLWLCVAPPPQRVATSLPFAVHHPSTWPMMITTGMSATSTASLRLCS